MDAFDKQKIAEIVAREIAKSSITPVFDLSLEKSCELIDSVLAEAKRIGVKGVAAVCDKGGNIKAVKCMDDSFIASYDIAVNKAYTSVALKMTTKELSELALPGGSLYGIQHTNGGRIVIFGGGVPLIKDGSVVGGFGISGGTEQQDTYLGDFAVKQFEKLF